MSNSLSVMACLFWLVKHRCSKTTETYWLKNPSVLENWIRKLSHAKQPMTFADIVRAHAAALFNKSVTCLYRVRSNSGFMCNEYSFNVSLKRQIGFLKGIFVNDAVKIDHAKALLLWEHNSSSYLKEHEICCRYPFSAEEETKQISVTLALGKNSVIS